MKGLKLLAKLPKVKKRIAIPVILLMIPLFVYVIPVTILNSHIKRSAKKLIKQEEQGRLSKEFGYVWSEINLNKEMQNFSREVTADDSQFVKVDVKTKKSRINKKYPSLEAVTILNSMDALSNRIQVLDRNGVELGEIKTTQKLLKLNEFPDLLTETLILTEDQNFYTRKKAYEPSAFYRAAIMSVVRSITSFKKVSPRGTSTIHQQVAKFLLSRFNDKGQIYIERSVNRKFREMRLGQALKMYFTDEEILTIYMNHCVTAGKGMVGYHDISMGLFGKEPMKLSEAQQLYLSRLVKWNRQAPEKIKRQVRVSLPRIAEEFEWDEEKVEKIKTNLDTMSFTRPPIIETEYSHLLDLANENWLRACELNGITGEQLADMDFSNPSSLIRRKGNLTIQLSVDIRLQRLLEKAVDARGYGSDTTITTDVRIGSFGKNFPHKKAQLPPDTLRRIVVLTQDSTVSEPDGTEVTLPKGDTLVTNVRYKWIKKGTARRSVFYYKRGPMKVQGQYFSYVMLDAPTGEILAYYSSDRLGSRLSSLVRNRVPNGSVLAKPMTYALNYDVERFRQYEMTSDSVEVGDTLDWHRKYLIRRGDTVGMSFMNVPEKEGYPVRNHHRRFEGYDYCYNHLARSNNVITVESMFKLNTLIKGKRSRTDSEQLRMDLIERIGFLDAVKKSGVSRVTGPRIYSEMASRVYGNSRGEQDGRRIISDENYSYALGTLELSTLEQAHLFNGFYNNSVIDKPASHPSLVLKEVKLAGTDFPLNDSLTSFQPFSDIHKITPVKLALYKRFTSNPADRMNRFDPCALDSRRDIAPIRYPLVNYAKSGTTDDILRPYNSDPALKEKTNYGLWHGTFRIKLPGHELKSLLPKGEKVPHDLVRDITVASVGECNRKNTGSPDGKSLHRFLTVKLMNQYGETGCIPGFYSKYEAQLITDTPDEIRYQESERPVSRLFSRMRYLPSAAELKFKKRRRGIRLDRKSRQKLESLSINVGAQQGAYDRLVSDLWSCRDKRKAAKILDRLEAITVSGSVEAEELKIGIDALRRSLDRM